MDSEVGYCIDFGDQYLAQLTPDELASLVVENKEIEFRIPIPLCRTMTDVAYSYLAASYILETLANNFGISKYTTSAGGGVSFNYNVKVKNFRADQIRPLVIEFLCILSDNEYIDEEEKFSFYENQNEFECNLNKVYLNFPEIVDLYYANQINGGLREAETEYFSELSIANPEFKYGYWLGASFLNKKDKVLYSQNCWIASKNVDIKQLFGDDLEDVYSIIPANLLLINSRAMVVSENGVMQISMGEVIQGIACIHDTFPNENQYSYHHLDSFNGEFFSQSATDDHFGTSEPTSFWQDGTAFKLYVSEFGEFVIFQTEEASLILFNVAKPTYQKARAFIKAMLTISSTFEDEIFSITNLDLDWKLLDAERFEQLCYDIIYHNSKFDRKTIRKMGKSCSRDGGRDIIVYTKEIHNKTPQMFIFQCKLINSSRSLGTTNVGSVSDVIDQYGADGYGIMSNSIIDASLYDKLDGISENRKVSMDNWSKLEIERFIARRPNLYERYFG